MAFALSIVNLQEALKKPGCPVCRLEHEAAVQSVDAFLWENTNDASVRQPINDAYGFCPEHSRLLVAKEMMTSGPVLGVNIVYALLAKKVSQELQRVHEKPRLFWRRKVKRGSTEGNHWLLVPHADCPLCKLAAESGANVLATLFELLTGQEKEFSRAYQQSAGICLSHLRTGLEMFGEQNPAAATFLVEDTVKRLETQQAQMLEYIRKHNWEYREEKLTADEQAAWLRTLTFFTGLPEQKFTHQIDEF